MKRILLTVVVGFAALATQAQLVVTQADFATAGDVLYIGRDTLIPGGVSVGAAGSGQTWSFTTLSVDAVDTLNFIDPSTLPDFATFPTSNISFKQLGGDAYVEKSATGIEILGFAGQLQGAPFPVVAPLNPTQTIMKFPAQLGLQFTDTSQIDVVIDISAFGGTYGVDSARLKRRFITGHNIDAEGSLTIPLGTYGAIRDKIDETTVDTIWIYSPAGNPLFGIQQGWQIVPDVVASFIGIDGGVTTATTRNYRWFGANSKFYIMDMATDANNAPISARYQADPSTLSVKEEVYNNKNVSIFPNPAADVVNVTIKDLKGKAMLTVFDATGRQVSSYALTSSQNTIVVNDLTNGLYMYRVAAENGTLLKTGKLLLAK